MQGAALGADLGLGAEHRDDEECHGCDARGEGSGVGFRVHALESGVYY